MSEAKTEIITFRLDAALKCELAAAAEAEGTSMAALVRQLMRQRIAQHRLEEKENNARCAT